MTGFSGQVGSPNESTAAQAGQRIFKLGFVRLAQVWQFSSLGQAIAGH
jgi:hypothetical protein